MIYRISLLLLMLTLGGCLAFDGFRDSAEPSGKVAVVPLEQRVVIEPISRNYFVLESDQQSVVGAPQIVLARQQDTFSDLAREYGLGYDELLAANPDCRIMAPMATEKRLVHDMGVERARVTLVDRDQYVQLSSGLAIHAIGAAHETLEIDEAGHCACLGYMVELAGTRLYHSGDCVPYEGLSETLKARPIDVALLPANGRDATRTSHGILGNFHFDEAVTLCCDAEIETLVPHHFGMFDFNTVDPAVWQGRIDDLDGRLQVVVPQMDQALLMDGSP